MNLNLCKHTALIIVFFCSSNVYAKEASIEWELNTVKDGVSVYTRTKEGSYIIEAKADITVQDSIDSLMSFYLNPNQCANWLPSCHSATLLEKSEAHRVVYRELSIPWPFKNHEYVLEQRITRTNNTDEVIVSFSDLKDYKTGTDCCHRYKAINGFWKFTPVNDEVRISYQIHFEPGGNFPSTVINKEIPTMLIETLIKLTARTVAE